MMIMPATAFWAVLILPSQANEDPPPTTQPCVNLVIRSGEGRPRARLRIDPRGVSELRLLTEPEVDWVIPRKDHAWDYREWQWWEGHPWGEDMRPRYWGNPRLDLEGINEGHVRLSYEADGFVGTQQFSSSRQSDPTAVAYDVVITIRNSSGATVSDYGQFFACYTPVNRRRSLYFWEKPTGLTLFADRGVGHLDGYVVSPESWLARAGRIPHCPRGDGKIAGTWHRPALISLASPGGWRSVIFIEASRCAAVTQGKEGNAIDYILYPGHEARRFRNGQAFSAHVRHFLIHSPELPGMDRLQELWNGFEADHQRVHDEAAARRQARERRP